MEKLIEDLIQKDGVSLFLAGNGPKQELKDLEQTFRNMRKSIMSVDQSKLKVEDGVTIIPDEYINIKNAANVAIEIFIGYAKREDSTIEEVEMVHRWMEEIVKMDCETFCSSTKRLDYAQDLKVLINNKDAIILTFLSNEKLFDGFSTWIEAFGKVFNISRLNVTVLNILEGKDKIRERYQKSFEKKYTQYMVRLLEGMGISKEDAVLNPSIIHEASILNEFKAKVNELGTGMMEQYFMESSNYLKVNYALKV